MKKPLSTQLLEAQNEVVALNAADSKLAKDLAASENSRKYVSDNCSAASAIVEDLHAMLDMLPTAPPRETPNPSSTYGGSKALSPAARLVGYVASRVA